MYIKHNRYWVRTHRQGNWHTEQEAVMNVCLIEGRLSLQDEAKSSLNFAKSKLCPNVLTNIEHNRCRWYD